MPTKALKKLLEQDNSGGLLLVVATVLALLCANVPIIAPIYTELLAVPIEVRLGSLEIKKNFLLVVNDGLMAIFFLLVALEIKREVIQGELSSIGQIILPGCAAIGGVAIPALFYVYFNLEDRAGLEGWAIPAATDIAFSLAVLSLFGKPRPAEPESFSYNNCGGR